MRRRTFLGAAAAALVPPAIRIIDTHTHFYDPTRPQGVPWPSKKEALLYRPMLPARFAATAAPLGVKGTVVVEASPWIEDNQWVLDLAEGNPIIVGFVGSLPVGKPEFRALLERFRKNRLFLGIRVGGNTVARILRDEAAYADIERLAGANLELDILGGASMLADVLRLAGRLPALRIAMHHLPFDWPEEPAAREEARAALKDFGRLPGVYAKVSGVLRRSNGEVLTDVSAYRPALDELWDVFGPDRLLYGSNWPVSEPLAPYETVVGVVRDYFAGKGEQASDKFFFGNSKATYGWAER
jgi:L-fuconolactonase